MATKQFNFLELSLKETFREKILDYPSNGNMFLKFFEIGMSQSQANQENSG